MVRVDLFLKCSDWIGKLLRRYPALQEFFTVLNTPQDLATIITYLLVKISHVLTHILLMFGQTVILGLNLLAYKANHALLKLFKFLAKQVFWNEAGSQGF